MTQKSETIFFTVINPDNEDQNRVNIEISDNFAINGLAIDSQQLAELGVLFLALAARQGVDVDSCLELLDGFNIPVPTKELKELANG